MNTPARVFDLEQPRTEDMPIHPSHKPGYSYSLHRRHTDTFGEDGPRSGASGLIICKEHSGTHIDALCHQAENMFLCGGIPVDAKVMNNKGFHAHSVDQIAPLVAPGVLLDVAAHFGVESLPDGYAVSAGELQACARRQNTEIAAGGVVLIHTGNETHWKPILAGIALIFAGIVISGLLEIKFVSAKNVCLYLGFCFLVLIITCHLPYVLILSPHKATDRKSVV